MQTASSNWYALFVRSRHEFVTFDELQKKGVEAFLPSTTKLRRWKDRNKMVVFPLFPGYLFVHIVPDAESFMKVIKTRGTVSFVSQEPGNPASIDPEEIKTLKMMIESGERIEIYPDLKEGTRVRVKRGPLAGAEGILVQKSDLHLFMVNIEILGRSIGVKIHGDELEQA